MQKELCHVSDLLDSRGLREGDSLIFRPLYGRRSKFKLMRTKIDFSTNSPNEVSGCHKSLDSLDREKLHYQLRCVKTMGRNREFKQRFLLTTVEGAPFRHNGNFTNEAFLERGDRVEMGHNELEVESPTKVENSLPIDDSGLKIIESDLPVLICGETGTGKTTLAKGIHKLSRPESNFVHLNLSSFSQTILESELFGHVKGAFTGAHNDKAGAFRDAKGGTLFLDEIDSLPIEIQTKLLIFLDEFKVRPVGASRDYQTECRLVCASGTDLKSLVKRGKMRKDFYYRIASGLSVSLPSMRYNEELVSQICARFGEDNRVLISNHLVEFYKTLPWPGNIRQLLGHLKKKMLYAKGQRLEFDSLDELLAVESSDLSELTFSSDERTRTLEDMKYEYVKSMYFKCGQNAAMTARKLAITPRSVKNILDRCS